MNLAEFIVNTIREESEKIRQEIIAEIRNGGGKTFLEQEVVTQPKVAEQPKPSNFLLDQAALRRVKLKSPNGTFDEEDMEQWVKHNHDVCTTIISAYRAGLVGNEVCRAVEGECGKPAGSYLQSSIATTLTYLRKFGYVKGSMLTLSATDKLRELRK